MLRLIDGRAFQGQQLLGVLQPLQFSLELIPVLLGPLVLLIEGVVLRVEGVLGICAVVLSLMVPDFCPIADRSVHSLHSAAPGVFLLGVLINRGQLHGLTPLLVEKLHLEFVLDQVLLPDVLPQVPDLVSLKTRNYLLGLTEKVALEEVVGANWTKNLSFRTDERF